MTIKNKETLEKLRTYQIGVIRSVIASRQGRLGTYSADATDRERLADTDGLAYEEYYESPLTIEHDGLCRNVISLEFCEDGLTPVCLMDGGDGFPLPLENLSCDTLQGIVEWLEEYDFIPSAEAAPQTTSDLTEDFVERCLPEYPTRYDVFRLGELQNFLWKVGTPEYDVALDEAAGMIARAERVFLVGIGNSGSIAEYGARYLSNLGKFALGVTDPFYPITVTPNTTIAAVILSVSGETKQVLHLARQLKEKNAGLIAITCSDQSSAAKLSDITLPYYSSVHRVTTESYDLTSQMPALYLLEALARRVYNRLLE